MKRQDGEGQGDVALRLHAVAIHLLRRVRAVDRETGLTAARLSALSVLVFGGARAVGELAETEQVTAPTMTRLVSGLEAEGLVRRSPDRRDGRRVLLTATAKGRRLLERGRARRVQEVEAVLQALRGGERRTVGRAVAALERALAAEP